MALIIFVILYCLFVLDGSGNLNVKLWAPVLEISNNSWSSVKSLIHGNSWLNDKSLKKVLERPMMETCAYYLYKEKRRGNSFDSVGKHFVLKWFILVEYHLK